MTVIPIKAGIRQYHEVTLRDGRPINWKRPPKANTIVSWTKRDYKGRKIIGSFRTLCHLNRLNNLSVKKFGKQITVIQRDYNTTVAASAGTHDFDATFDLWIYGVDGWVQQRFFRTNGLGCWLRYPPKFGFHIHGFTLPPHVGTSFVDDFKNGGFKVGKYIDGGYSIYGKLVTSAQLSDVYNKKSGLAGHAHDPSWYPPSTQATIFNLNQYVQTRVKALAA